MTIMEPRPYVKPKEKTIEELCKELEKMKPGLERFADNRDVRMFIESKYVERILILRNRGHERDAEPYKAWLDAYKKVHPFKY